MAEVRKPDIDCDKHHASLSVRDILAATKFYETKLGFNTAFTWGGDPPTFAGVTLGSSMIFLEKGTPSPDGTAVYFVVGDADELFAFHRDNGAVVVEPPGDREYGIRDYMIRDLDGNRLGFGHYIYNMGDPVLIERVDVPVRLEKRLAALLRDLAAHKRMSVDSCLEEMLMHTSEPLGDGVASPHTASQLRYIQELKKKHGIDYDCHATYRFRER